jgi:hypothetical protein
MRFERNEQTTTRSEFNDTIISFYEDSSYAPKLISVVWFNKHGFAFALGIARVSEVLLSFKSTKLHVLPSQSY